MFANLRFAFFHPLRTPPEFHSSVSSCNCRCRLDDLNFSDSPPIRRCVSPEARRFRAMRARGSARARRRSPSPLAGRARPTRAGSSRPGAPLPIERLQFQLARRGRREVQRQALVLDPAHRRGLVQRKGGRSMPEQVNPFRGDVGHFVQDDQRPPTASAPGPA